MGAPRGAQALLRGHLRELCAAISQNNPTCFKLTWGFAFRERPDPSGRGKSGGKTSHNSLSCPPTKGFAPSRRPSSGPRRVKGRFRNPPPASQKILPDVRRFCRGLPAHSRHGGDARPCIACSERRCFSQPSRLCSPVMKPAHIGQKCCRGRCAVGRVVASGQEEGGEVAGEVPGGGDDFEGMRLGERIPGSSWRGTAVTQWSGEMPHFVLSWDEKCERRNEQSCQRDDRLGSDRSA